MRLDDLPWQTSSIPSVNRRVAFIGHGNKAERPLVVERVDGTYAIVLDGRNVWRELDPFTAQCVLYHIFPTLPTK